VNIVRPPTPPTYGPPVQIPSAHALGLAAYWAWGEAMGTSETTDWQELREQECNAWERVGLAVAKRVQRTTEQSRALGNYLPPPACPAYRRDNYMYYICCRWDPHPADYGTDFEGHRWVPVEP
jgi:hypothetical protein